MTATVVQYTVTPSCRNTTSCFKMHVSNLLNFVFFVSMLCLKRKQKAFQHQIYFLYVNSSGAALFMFPSPQ